jgi:hypothetical protein
LTTGTAALISISERVTFRKDSMMIGRYIQKTVQATIPNKPFMGDEMSNILSERIRYVFSVISKRRWWIIAPYCFSLLVGLSVSIISPEDYEATALIMAQPERVPEMLARPIANSEVEERARSLSQQILSRRNLEHVINVEKLFSDPSSRSMLMEDKVESLRRRTRVALISSNDSSAAKTFSISFRDANPELTMRVANRLSTLFVEESSTSREAQAIGSGDFLETELNSIRKDLEEKEQALRDNRRRTGDELYDKEFTTLKRDYENIKAIYNSLLSRKLETDISINLGKKSRNELFRVLDKARIPHEPVSAGRHWWLAAFPLSSLAVGFGLIFLLEIKGARGWKQKGGNAVRASMIHWRAKEISPNDSLKLKEFFYDPLLHSMKAEGVEKSDSFKGDCEIAGSDDFQNVNFSAFYPRQAAVGDRSVIAIYAHIQDYLNVVRNDVLKFKELFDDQAPTLKKAKDFALLKDGVLITVVPQCDIMDFNPKQITLRWESPFIRFLFDFKPGKILADETLVIKFSFQVEGFQIAHLNCAVDVVDKLQGRDQSKLDAFETGSVYDKIFVSYSLKDKEAVEGYRKIFEAFKRDIFIDSYSIDPSEKRSEVVGSLLKECDAFYLFWSENAAASERVRGDFQAAIEAMGAQPSADTFLRPICWDTPLHPEPWPELKDSVFTYLPKLKQDSVGGNGGYYSGLQAEAVPECFSYLKVSIGPDSEDFERAINYTESDPKGSLNKSRIVLESLLLDAYRREMGRPPRVRHLQMMLEDNQFTRRIDRNVQFRMAYVRNFGNMGSHAGEVAKPNDAVDCLRNLICLIQWHKNNYSENHMGSKCNSLTPHSGSSREGRHPSPPTAFDNAE